MITSTCHKTFTFRIRQVVLQKKPANDDTVRRSAANHAFVTSATCDRMQFSCGLAVGIIGKTTSCNMPGIDNKTTIGHVDSMSALTDWLSESSPISRKNAAEAVFEELRSAIISGRIEVGRRLPSEAHLASKYGVSRPVIREALRSLQTLGMTQTRTGSGTFVTTATPSSDLSYSGYSARDLIEARPFIEVPAAGWAALRRTKQQSARLLKLCDEMEKEEDPLRWVRLDSDFHMLLAEASGNAVFAKIVMDARDALMQQSELVNLMASRRVASNREHRQIATAVDAGSQDDASRAMELHLGQVKLAVTEIIGTVQPDR